jgi:hypothetical protein
MNAATSTVASAGTSSPRNSAVSAAVTTKTIHGPTWISRSDDVLKKGVHGLEGDGLREVVVRIARPSGTVGPDCVSLPPDVSQ